MNNVLRILLVCVLFSSCSMKKPLLNYGSKENLLIYNTDKEKINSVNFKIENYTFYFSKADFRNIINDEYDTDFPAFSYLKDFELKYLVDGQTEILEKDSELYLNNTIVNFPLSYDLKIAMDILIKKGEFYVEHPNKIVKYVEYISWEPQYQGSIYSRWIIDDKKIYEFVKGFVD